MVLHITLPLRPKTQGDVGKVEPGTPAGAPANLNLRRKIWIATGIACVLWLVCAGIIVSGVISVRDLDWFNRMDPPLR